MGVKRNQNTKAQRHAGTILLLISVLLPDESIVYSWIESHFEVQNDDTPN